MIGKKQSAPKIARGSNRELFENTPVARAVGTMAIPTIIGQLIVLIYNMADTFFIGRTKNSLMVAGASLILPVFNISLSIASIAGVGGGALISRLFGEHRDAEAKRVSSFSIWFSAALAVLFSLLTLIFMDPLLGLLGADEQTFDYARTYALCVIVTGGLPTIMTNVLANLVRSIGESKKAGFGVTLGGVVNIALDPLFMFVILSPGNEILGAGIATCLSNLISCAYFIAVMVRLGRTTPLGLLSPLHLPTRRSVGQIFTVGVPSAVATLLFDVDYIVIDKLMSGYSNAALAAVGIVLKAERLPLNVGVGICQGMVPIVAYNFATHNYDRMRRVARFSLLTGVIFALFSISLYELFAPAVMRFFIDDAETVALGTTFLRIRCLATLFMFSSFYHVHLFNSYGRGGYALFLGIMRWAVFNIPMLFLMNAWVGMYGIVWSQLIADVLTVALSLAVHSRFSKRHFRSAIDASGQTEDIMMQKVVDFLKDAEVYYLATVEEGGQPRVRPFGTAHVFEGKLYIQTGKIKPVAHQIAANPMVEICAFKNGKWLRVAGELCEDDRVEARKSMLDAYPSLRSMYDENDGNTVVYYFKNATATFSSFTSAPEVVRF